MPLSPIHESDMEFPSATTSSSNTNQQQHPPLLASIGPQSRLVSRSTFYITSNCDDSVQDVEVQDLEVLPDTHSNPN